MIRIVAGTLGGRRLVLPADRRVRPTRDQVREAWMSILGERLLGARVLDLYAGSGALGFEALSRGASLATLVDQAPASLQALRQNAQALGVVDRVTIVRREALRYLQSVEGLEFEIAFADPPYGYAAAEAVVARFRAQPFAAVLGIEHSADRELQGDDTRRYGDTAITFCYAT